MTVTKRKHNIALVAIILGVTIWGAGFVFTDMCLKAGATASFTNMLRFVTATILIGAIFYKRIKLNRWMLLYGFIGGALLFGAFMLQLSALYYTTPANNGFFTASYVLFVPLIMWALVKKPPTWITVFGMVTAIAGLFILSFGGNMSEIVSGKENSWIGDLMTIGCGLFFAIQMIISDRILQTKNADAMAFTFVQIMFAAVLFTLYFLIFDLTKMNFATVDWKGLALPLAFVAVLGTAYAYPAQINAQKYLTPSETSLIMSTESVIGAILSVLVGSDEFGWPIVVGGLLVTVAIISVEALPNIIEYRRRNNRREWEQPPIDMFPEGEYHNVLTEEQNEEEQQHEEDITK